MKELAVIIPMYNEQQNAEKCVRAVCQVLSKNLPGSRLLIVNDGSKDDTRQILERLKADSSLPFDVISHPTNYGYGKALLTGMKTAYERGFEFGLFMDSDLTNDPALLPQFAEKLQTGNFDLVKASRFVPGGGMSGVPWRRQIFSIVGNKIACALFQMGLKDCTNGFHAVRLKFLVDQTFEENGFPFLLEELYLLKKQGVRTAEIPYTLTSRDAEQGTTSFAYTPTVIRKYLKYALKSSLVGRHTVGRQ